MFPLVLDLQDRRVVVVGAGRVGARKARDLVEAGARVTVIAREVLVALPPGVEEVVVRPYREGDLAGSWLVVAASGDAAVNDRIAAEANEGAIPLNVVDDPARCSFYFTAVHRDGEVIVAVSSSGAAPALAQWVRDAVREALPRGLSSVAATLRVERRALHAAGESTEHRDWASRVRELVASLTSTTS